MPKYIDEEGNEVETTISLADLQAAAEAKTKIEEELNHAKEQLAKQENKDMNWKRLNNMAEEEVKKLSSREMELIKRQEALEDRQKTWQEQQLMSHKNNALSRFGVYDDEVKAKVLANYDRIKDDATTEEQVLSKMRDAVTIATGSSPNVRMNPLFAGSASLGMAPSARGSSPVSGDVAELAKKLGLSAEDLKNIS